MANTYFDWCVCIHRFFQSGQLNFFTHADSRSDVWSVCTEITKNLGTMVVEADDKNDSGITAKKILPKPILLASDVPPPSNQIIQEVRNLGDSVKNGFVTSDKNLKSQISNFDELLKGRANTLNNSIKNVSSDVSTMSRTVTQEVSAVSKGISGLSGMVTGVSGAVTSIANGAVMSLLLENIVKPMFDTTNNTIDLGRVTMQKFFEKQIAIFQPGSTSTTIDSNDSLFVTLLKNLGNATTRAVENVSTSINNIFTVSYPDMIPVDGESWFIRLIKNIGTQTISSINSFEQSFRNVFKVFSDNAEVSDYDSPLIKLFKNLFRSVPIPNFANLETKLVDIIKTISKVPALNELIKNGFSDLSNTFASITEPLKNIGVTIMKALFESITKFFIPSDPNFLKNKIKGIQEKFNTKFQVPLGFLSLFKTLFGFERTPFPKQFTLKLYGKDNHVPLELVSLMSEIIRPILTSLLCFTILIECYKRVTGSDEAVLQ